MPRSIVPSEGAIYPARGGYAHAMAMDGPARFVFTSGTMGLDEDWGPPPTIEQQLERAWANIGTILAADSLTMDNIVHITSYLSHPGHAKANAAARAVALGGREVPTTVISVTLLDPCWLVEIQVVAAERLDQP